MAVDRLPSLSALLAAADQLVAGRAFGTGAVVGVLSDGCIDVAAVGAGLDGVMSADAVIELHCAAKPLVAHGAALAVAASGWDPASPVGVLVPQAAHLGPEVTVVSLVNHGARLARPAALHWVATPPPLRPRVADLSPLPLGDHAYSEVGAGLVLACAIEALAGVPAEAFFDAEVLAPLGVTGDVTLSARSIGQEHRLEPVLADLPGRAIPMLHPMHPAFRARQDIAFGGYATASAFLAVVQDSFDHLGSSPVLCQSRGRAYDHVLRRDADFRAGYLVAGPGWLPGLLFSVTSIANVVVAVVPAQRWAAFAFLNGLVPGREDAAFTRRTVFAGLRTVG